MPEHYEKAPIVDAIIDIRVVLPEGVGLEVLGDFKASLEKSFPQQQDAVHNLVEIKDNAQTEVTEDHIGFRLISDEKDRALTVGVGGFTFSYSGHYESWSVFKDEAFKLWRQYSDACRPVAVSRVALRYINRFDLPIDDRLNSYITLHPSLPLGLPGRETVQGLFMQLLLPQTDIESILIINQAKVPSPNPETTSIILDFDLFREQQWPVDDAEIWAVLEVLRLRKNEVFESCITQKMKERIR